MIKIKTDNYTNNGLKIKKIGGVAGVKIFFKSPNTIDIKFKHNKLEHVIRWIYCNFEEFGNIYENVEITPNSLTCNMVIADNVCQIELKINDYFSTLKNQTAFCISPWLPDEWYLTKESSRLEETDEEL